VTAAAGPLSILLSAVLPIFVLIGLGAAMDRGVGLDLRTLAKLNFYLFAPALLFVKLIETTATGSEAAQVAFFTLLHASLMFALAWRLMRGTEHEPNREVLSMGAAFYNCGNFGIPLVILAFGEAWVALLALVIMVQNTGTYMVGAFLFEGGGRRAWGRSLRGMARLPILWAVALGGLCRWAGVDPPGLAMKPLEFLADALVPAALLTLGAQLARNPLPRGWRGVSLVAVLRLAVSPLLGAGLATLLGVQGVLWALLVTVTALPMAVNVFIVAAEYEHDAELASQAITWTTLASALTVAVVLWLAA
jgi:predicted permease